MIETPIKALERLGREIRRLEEVEDRGGMPKVDFTGWQDSVFNAASIAYHLVDGCFHTDPSISEEDKKEAHIFGEFRSRREAECPELALCGDIANRVKHTKLTRPRTKSGRTDLTLGNTKYIGMEVSQSGVRTHVQQCAITINDEPVVPLLNRAFDYWASYLAARDNVPVLNLPAPQQPPLTSVSIPRPGGYYCPQCRTAIVVLIPHSDHCGNCGTPYQDIPS